VLVVEDDPMTLGLLAETLAQAGFTVGAAATAAQAQEMWERMAPEAVVLDIDLGPGASGSTSPTHSSPSHPASQCCSSRPC
jgi:DNA-binding response OmpR family regulator